MAVGGSKNLNPYQFTTREQADQIRSDIASGKITHHQASQRLKQREAFLTNIGAQGWRPGEGKSGASSTALDAFIKRTERDVGQQQSTVARGAARRGMMTSGQSAAIQREIHQRGQERISEFELGEERMSKEFDLRERGLDIQQESVRKQYALGLRRAEAAEAAGWGQMGGMGLGLLLASYGAAKGTAMAAAGPAGWALMGVSALGALFD